MRDGDLADERGQPGIGAVCLKPPLKRAERGPVRVGDTELENQGDRAGDEIWRGGVAIASAEMDNASASSAHDPAVPTRRKASEREHREALHCIAVGWQRLYEPSDEDGWPTGCHEMTTMS